VPQDSRFFLRGDVSHYWIEGEGLIAVHAATARSQVCEPGRACAIGAVFSQGFIVVAVGAGNGNHVSLLTINPQQAQRQKLHDPDAAVWTLPKRGLQHGSTVFVLYLDRNKNNRHLMDNALSLLREFGDNGWQGVRQRKMLCDEVAYRFGGGILYTDHGRLSFCGK